MIPNSPEGSDDTSSEHEDYGDVVELVRSLGAEAVEQFLDGLASHLAAIQRKDEVAVDGLISYLHQCAISAAFIAQRGGVDAIRLAGQAAADGPVCTREEAIAKLSQLAS